MALLYKLNNEWLFRARAAAGYGTPQVSNLFVLPSGLSGNNTQLDTQKNLGYDVGFDWTPNNALKLSATGFYEFFRNELVSQATPLAGISYTFNAPRSEHHGVELAADWKFYPGWRFTAAYTYLDEVYTQYTENITNGAVFSFNRVGNKIPGISPNELTTRLGYDELSGRLAGPRRVRRGAVERLALHGQRQPAKGAGLRTGQSECALQDRSCFGLFQDAQSLSGGQKRLQHNVCCVREQYCRYRNRRGYPEFGERFGDDDQLDLRGLTESLHRGNESGFQMIDGPTSKQGHAPRENTRGGRLSALASRAYAQMSHQHVSEAACDETALRCASKVTPAFGPDGTLWLAWMAGGQISVASSKDDGKSFSAPVQVTKERPNLDWGPDARPKIVVDRNGGIALAFSIFRDKAFNGQVLYTRSKDGGQSFAELRPITTNNESQRFEALALDADGSVFAAWLDKRNRVPAQQSGRNTKAPVCSLRHRMTAARPIPKPGWRKTTPANAAGWGWHSPDRAVPSLSSGTFLRGAFGITRS